MKRFFKLKIKWKLLFLLCLPFSVSAVVSLPDSCSGIMECPQKAGENTLENLEKKSSITLIEELAPLLANICDQGFICEWDLDSHTTDEELRLLSSWQRPLAEILIFAVEFGSEFGPILIEKLIEKINEGSPSPYQDLQNLWNSP